MRADRIAIDVGSLSLEHVADTPGSAVGFSTTLGVHTLEAGISRSLVLLEGVLRLRMRTEKPEWPEPL